MARPREFDIDEALDAAMGVFWERGYEATSMVNLMDATGLHKGSIYKAFEDKHDLFLQALRRYLNNVYHMFHSTLTAAKTPMEGFQALMGSMTHFCDAQETRRGCFAVNSAVEMTHHDEEVAKVIKKHFARVEKLLAEHIIKGQQLGEFRKDMPAVQLAEAFLVYLSGMLAQAKGPHSKKRTARLCECGLKMLTKSA